MKVNELMAFLATVNGNDEVVVGHTDGGNFKVGELFSLFASNGMVTIKTEEFQSLLQSKYVDTKFVGLSAVPQTGGKV